MPPISIPDFDLPHDAKPAAKKSPEEMIKAAFRALDPWFAKIIDTIELEWKAGVTNKDDKVVTQIRLGKLAGSASGMGELLMEFVNNELKANPKLTVDKFKLPKDATNEGPLPAPEMVGKAFQALKPWFHSLVKIIRPCYTKIATANATPTATFVRLSALETTVNTMKSLLVTFVNQEIARKEKGQSFNALASGEEEAELTPQASLTVLEEILDVDIGDNEPANINEDVSIDLGEALGV